MMSELKPCPFCGLSPKMRESDIGNITAWVVYCPHTICKVKPQTAYIRKRTDAIEAWNRRVDNE